MIVQLLFTSSRTVAFWLTLVAMFGLIAMQLVYWMFTHPTNKFWLKSPSVALGDVGGGFFASDPAGRFGSRTEGGEGDWRKLRNRWEYSHIARAGLAFVSFFFLLLAMAIRI